MGKSQCRSYDAISEAPLTVVEKLEQSVNDNRPDYLSKKEKRIRHWKDKLEEHKEAIKEAYQSCRLCSYFRESIFPRRDHC